MNASGMLFCIVVATTPVGPLTSWETTDGEMIRGEAPLGMSMFSETKEVATNFKSVMPKFAILSGPGASATKSAYVPPKDFALVQQWRSLGIPVEVVERGIDEAFSRREERGGAGRVKPPLGFRDHSGGLDQPHSLIDPLHHDSPSGVFSAE